MRKIVIILLISLFSIPINAQTENALRKEQLNTMKIQIETIDKDIDSLELCLNHLEMQLLINLAKEQDISISVFAIKSINFNKLFTTVPAIKEQRNQFIDADNSVTNYCRQDTSFQQADNRQRNLRISAEERSEANKECRSIFQTMVEKDPQLKELNDIRNQMLAQQNALIMEYLLQKSKDENKPFTEIELLSRDYYAVIRNDSEIKKVRRSIEDIRSIRQRLNSKYTKLKYNLDNDFY
ncbi:MAG: hypothetical protein ACRDDZ_13605 [Marinifilaceae bacterium]